MLWTDSISTAVIDEEPEVHNVTVDSSGSVVVGGDFDGTGALGADGDIYLRRYSPNGSVVGDVEFGTNSTNQLIGAVASSGTDVIAGGGYFDTLSFGGGTPLPDINNTFVGALSSGFSQQWSDPFGSGNMYGAVFDIAVDPAGAIAAVGASGGRFAANYSAGGAVDWMVFLSGTGSGGAAVALSSTGTYLCGRNVGGTVSLGGPQLSGNGSYFGKLDANGNHAWSKVFPGEIYMNDLVVTSDDRVVVTGWFSGTQNLGGADLMATDSLSDIFVAAFDAGGNHIWSSSFGGIGRDRAIGIGRNSLNQLVVTGWLSDSIDFGGGPVTTEGARDVFVAELDILGTHIWSQNFGSAGDDEPSSIDVSNAGEIAIVGTFSSTIMIGTNILTPSSPAGVDAFVVKLGP